MEVALRDFEAAVRVEPTPDGFKRLGQTLAGLGRDDEAVAILDRSVALQPVDAGADIDCWPPCSCWSLVVVVAAVAAVAVVGGVMDLWRQRAVFVFDTPSFVPLGSHLFALRVSAVVAQRSFASGAWFTRSGATFGVPSWISASRSTWHQRCACLQVALLLLLLLFFFL